MPILPMVSATKTLDKVMCLACDLKHSRFENGIYRIVNDTIEHTRIIDGETVIYQPCPFTFNLPSQSETDNSSFAISNVGLFSGNILKAADNSFEDIVIQCWLIVADYDGKGSFIDLGEYIANPQQAETTEWIQTTLAMKTCYDINVGKYRGKNPKIFINLNHR